MSEARQFLALFGDSVARYLSAGKLWWKVNRVDDTHIELRGADGMKITLWCGAASPMLQDEQQDKIKFKVKGEYPPDVFLMPEDKPEINVGYSKGAKAMANDIQRRFLSKYIPLYYEKLEIQQRIERERDARERVMATLAEAFGWREVRDTDSHLVRLQEQGQIKELDSGHCSYKDTYRGKLNARLMSSLQADAKDCPQRWEVDIELKSLTVGQALRIAEVLKEPAFPPEQLSLL